MEASAADEGTSPAFVSSSSKINKHLLVTPLLLLGPPSAMASPAILGSRALRASRKPIQLAASSRRGYAAATAGSFSYETGDASGVKYAARDMPGATTTLAVVAKAGTRFQPYPGYADALEKFAFKVWTIGGV